MAKPTGISPICSTARASIFCRSSGRLAFFLMLSFCPLPISAQESNAGDWPRWRGPTGNGIGSDENLPVRFGPSENVLWKTPVAGRGHSSPIVVGDQVILATADEARQTHSVVAFDLNSGAERWTRQLSQGGFPARNHPKNTEASSTVASDGSLLFTTFFHHRKVVLSALTLRGEVAWEREVSPFNPKRYEYGYAPSPLLFKDLVIVAAEHDGPSFLVAYQRETGKEVWRTKRSPNITFSSPVIAKVAGKDQLLISGSGLVTSYAPATGKMLWQVPGTTSATCGTMVWDGNLVFASGGYPKAETIAVVADGSRRIAWKNAKKCYEQSMIVVDGYLYGLTDRGVLYCWRGRDGKEMWRQRLSGPVSASPVYAGGHVYWANEAGTVYVFRPNPQKFELVAENRLGDEAFASPAITGGKILLRVAEGGGRSRREFLVCIGN
ncbi:MAG: PQQ-binding-like beta-propeller repeat protein [Planctomycetota bacterium]